MLRAEHGDADYGIITDATPHQGHAFAMVSRFIVMVNGRPKVVQRLKDVHFLKKHLTGLQQAAVFQGCVENETCPLRLDKCVGSMGDGASVNNAMHTKLHECSAFRGFPVLCCSHLSNNAFQESNGLWPTLVSVWTQLMNISRSDMATAIFYEVTEQKWISFSGNRWFSRREVLENILKAIDLLPKFAETCIDRGYCTDSAAKLLKLITTGASKRIFTIELQCLVECTRSLHNFCYAVEGDGQLIFKFADQVEYVLRAFPDSGYRFSDSLKAQITEANGALSNHPDRAAFFAARQAREQTELSVSDVSARVDAIRPRRRAARENVATLAAMSRAQIAAKKAEEILEAKRRQEELERLLMEEALLQAAAPPCTYAEWDAHLRPGYEAIGSYMRTRLTEGGDRYDLVVLSRAARLWNPHFVSNLPDNLEAAESEAQRLLEGLKLVPRLNCNVLIRDLMVEFTTYYREVKANKLIYKKDPEDIIGWHYDRRVNTHFVSARPNWWKVAAILVLIQPSSAACERVFSLLNNSFSNKQSKALADYIILSLMMQFNKRRVTPKISKTPEALESSSSSFTTTTVA